MNQNHAILEHLKKGYSLTPIEALQKFGCMRLGARIWELIHDHNIDIRCEMVNDHGKHYARYYLPRREQQYEMFNEPMVQIINTDF